MGKLKQESTKKKKPKNTRNDSSSKKKDLVPIVKKGDDDKLKDSKYKSNYNTNQDKQNRDKKKKVFHDVRGDSITKNKPNESNNKEFSPERPSNNFGPESTKKR